MERQLSNQLLFNIIKVKLCQAGDGEGFLSMKHFYKNDETHTSIS